MHPIFKITSADIQALNDEQARELVARLCRAELNSKGLGTAPITWGGDQRAKDGGVDVRVDIASSMGVNGYIPRNATAYQVKAEQFAPAKISGEMAPNGVVRTIITELGEQSGAYIIVSTKDNCSDSSLENRKQAMINCLKDPILIKLIHVDFYDSRKIADWVENFPAIVIWVRNKLGKPLDGWKPYKPWAYYETNIEDEYLLDEKVKIFAPNSEQGLNIISAIDRLRGELGKNSISIRIVGLSGVGKTRFVQALFDPRISTSNVALNSENVLYTDLSDNPTPKPIAILEALLLDGSDCVVVIDNCGQDIHQKLTEIVKRLGSKIKIVTIEYDIRDDFPESTLCYRLEGASNEVITQLLKRRYRMLSDLDINKIVEFSDGNARVAFALASLSESKGELSQLTDEALFQRLFLQKHSESDELKRCAEAASLLYSFDIEDRSETSELAILSSVSEVSIQTFFRNVKELQRRGLVQERGKWRAILPHAISNRLAHNAIQENPPGLLVEKFVVDSTERVARSFSRRLGYLHESKHAKQIAQEWLKPEGLLGDMAQLNAFKIQILENIAPVNQRVALDSLLRAMTNKDFISISNPNRSHITRLLRLLSYEQDQFEDAATALLQFALEESDDYNSDSTRKTLQSLFYIYLSGTHAVPEQRATFVKTLVLSEDKAKQKLVLTLLRAGLESSHFSSNYNFDFGALKRDYGWQPQNVEERKKWYELFISITVELGKNLTTNGSDARSLLGEMFRGLWTSAVMHEALADAAEELAAIDGWPDGWIGIRKTIHWNKNILSLDTLETLKALEKKLAPQDLLAKIKAKILSPGAFWGEIYDASESETPSFMYQKCQKEAETLGREAALDENALLDLTPYVFANKSNDKSWHFGYGIGQEAFSTDDILTRIKLVLDGDKTRNFNRLFIKGIIAGWNKANPEKVSEFLDKAIEDDIWGPMFPALQTCIELDDVAHSRLLKCLEIGKAPASQYKTLDIGRVTDTLSAEQIGSLLSLLAIKPDNGLEIAVDVICMVIHFLNEKSPEYRSELQIYCSRFIEALDWASINLDQENFLSDLENLIEFTLAGSTENEAAVKALTSFIHYQFSSTNFYPRQLGRILVPFFKHCPEDALNACHVQDNDGNYKTASRILAIQFDEYGETAVSALTELELINWCKASLNDRIIFAAQTCKLYEKSKPDGLYNNSSLSISNTAKSILARAPDKKRILEFFIDRFKSAYFSRSRSETMRHRLQLLDQFNPHEDEKLQAFIDETKISFSKDISDFEQQEAGREKSNTASFE